MGWVMSAALVRAYENSRCSQERAAEFSAATSSGGEPSAPLSGSHTPHAYLSSDRTTAFFRLSRFGMTFAPLTDDRGADVLMWCQAGSRAKRTAQHLEDGLWLTISGRKCGGSWQMSLPGTYLPKTWPGERLTPQPTTLKRWVTRSGAVSYPRRTWVQTTFGPGIGYLHTPTTMANFCAPSMQKHPGCRAWRQVFGAVSPGAFEYLMAWPEGWTDLSPLETGKSLCVPPKRGESLQEIDV